MLKKPVPMTCLWLSIHDLCVVASLPWDEQPGRVFD